MLKTNKDRRQFLISALKTSGQIVVANSVIYNISLVSKAGQFGDLTAGAKTWYWESSWGRVFCPTPSPMGTYSTKAACDAARSSWMRSQPSGGIHCSLPCDSF